MKPLFMGLGGVVLGAVIAGFSFGAVMSGARADLEMKVALWRGRALSAWQMLRIIHLEPTGQDWPRDARAEDSREG
jgi:hypothetical protein